MTVTIDPTIPLLAADWLDTHEWVQGSGDGKTSGCLTTATLTVCGDHPGDRYLWVEIERHRCRAENWNDTPGRTKGEVVTCLRTMAVPDEAEMVAVFGPQWAAFRDLVRRATVLTAEEVERLAASRAAVRDAVRGAAGAAVWGASRAASRDASWVAAWDTVWAAVRDASRAAVRDAAWVSAGALVVRDLIGQYGYTQAHYDLLTGPWASVIGPVHPDDVVAS